MTDPHIDPVVNRAVSELRKLPPVDRDAVSRIVAAAAAARVSPAADDDVVAMPPRRRPWGLTLGLAAAALVAGFVLRGVFTSPPAPSTMATRQPTAAVTTTPVTAGDPESMPIATAFTLERGAANRVSLIGDFNSWNPTATRLVRQPGTNIWTVVTPIRPGRHVYAFMIDDTMLVLDPRASRAKDPTLNVDVSVVMVGKP